MYRRPRLTDHYLLSLYSIAWLADQICMYLVTHLMFLQPCCCINWNLWFCLRFTLGMIYFVFKSNLYSKGSCSSKCRKHSLKGLHKQKMKIVMTVCNFHGWTFNRSALVNSDNLCSLIELKSLVMLIILN